MMYMWLSASFLVLQSCICFYEVERTGSLPLNVFLLSYVCFFLRLFLVETVGRSVVVAFPDLSHLYLFVSYKIYEP